MRATSSITTLSRVAAYVAMALGSAGAVSCASSAAATEQRRSVVDTDREIFRQADQGIPVTFTADRDDVWKALVGAYSDIGLLPDAADTSVWVVTRSKVVMRRMYNGVRTSALFACGETAMGTARADLGQITASIRSQITGAGTSTRVATLVDGWVVLDGGTSSNALHCGSTGILEERLHKAVAARLGRAQAGS